MKRTIVLAAVAIGLAGCGMLEPNANRVRRPAYIRFSGEPTLLEAPDTVSAGVAFTVTIRSFGGGCIGMGNTQAEVRGLVAEVRPFDVFTTSKTAVCTRELALYDHTASVQVDQSGVATIRATGRAYPSDTTTTIERQVVVR